MKIALCGLWHVHAEGYYQTAAKYADVIGVYEPNPEWREAFCSKYGAHPFTTFEELLGSGADAVLVCTATDQHADMIVRLAEAGMDIFTEKVLALTSADCERIEAAIMANHVKFVISFPHKYSAGVQTVKKIVDGGELGKINYFRFRNVHNGSTGDWLPTHFYSEKECGGGAMIDLGAHGMYLAEWICGMPSSAKSVFTRACDREDVRARNTDGVEDNAVTVMQYASGCIAINETGFVSVGFPMTLEIGGELGRVTLCGSRVEKQLKGMAAAEEMALESALPSPLEQFCTGRILPGCGIREAKNLTRLMEMAYGH